MPSSSTSSRAVYIPPAKRKRQGQPDRFHGAFTGGFSAGYFNTVDTKEGWKPSAEQRREQKLEDFMDEQDHHEWGGPTTVREEYKSNESNGDAVRAPLASLLEIKPPPSVGLRLLRHLGWRESTGTAFVPASGDDSRQADDYAGGSKTVHLSKKRLKQIKLQSTRIQIPPPKLDKCGLGFEALADAPEFRRHRERRQEMARLRAHGHVNVYRVANLMGGGEGDGNTNRPASTDKKNYLSYETTEDFVGTRSSSGFALRDDEDDAYDQLALGGDRRSSQKPSENKKLLSQEYHTEIVDIDEDSDVDDHPDHLENTAAAAGGNETHSSKAHTQATKHLNATLSGVLASWAGSTTAKSDDKESKAPSLTGSGKPPLSGFRLGGSTQTHRARYPGPDIPLDYELKPHVFGPNERPEVYQTIGRAMQIEVEQQARHQKAIKASAGTYNEPGKPLVNTNHFSTLAAAMKDRFTTGTAKNSQGTAQGNPGLKPGLYQPRVVTSRTSNETTIGKATSEDQKATSKSIQIRRSTHPFAPVPLLCKRFGVPVPRQHIIPQGEDRMTETSYFEKEILSKTRDAPFTRDKAASLKAPTADQDLAEDNAEVEFAVERPTKEELKAIFQPEQDSDDASSSDPDTDLDSTAGGDKTDTIAKSGESSSMVPYKESVEEESFQNEETPVKERSLVPHASKQKDTDVDSVASYSSRESSSRRSRERRRRKQRKKKRSSSKRKRKKRSHESGSSGSDDSPKMDKKSHKRDRHRLRSRKHSKKKKKRRSSSPEG